MKIARGLVLIACVAISFAAMLAASKHTARIVLYASWLVASNTFFLLTALAGSLAAKRGHVLA